MAKNLVIVESPAKAKTIGKFLGKDYAVKASVGHIRDLPKSTMGIDIENDFEPKYISIRGKGDVIKELKDAAKKSQNVFLATDPDREGEAIAWHLKTLLNIDSEKKCRITFNAITKETVKASIQNARVIDQELVDAQQARRVLDRLVGYSISPLLWRKLRKGLSAGRVQSVATKMIVDREREIDAFIPKEYWTVDVDVMTKDKATITASYVGFGDEKQELVDGDTVKSLLKTLDEKQFTVTEAQTKPKSRSPYPPFTTSTLQQEAANQFGFQTKKTMMIAQQLYEGIALPEGTVGLITYMRTDSIRISDEAKSELNDFILETYGEAFAMKGERKKPTKQQNNAQDAHEAVRPTATLRTPISLISVLTKDQYQLYKLIWERFVASGMTDAQYETQQLRIEQKGYTFKASGQTLVFKGFLEVYSYSTSKDKILPKLTIGDTLKLVAFHDEQHFTQPPARYTEATLVKEMEENGIGRPSTYAPTISTIMSRAYVIRDKKSIKPTELGYIITELMEKYFSMITEIEFTANFERSLDGVEAGEVAWKNIIRDFYAGFDENLKKAEQDIEKIDLSEPTDIPCEKCESMMMIRQGKFGKFLACSNYPTCTHTKPILQKIDVHCPKCAEGQVVERKTKKMKVFYGCDQFPNCDFISWKKPTGEMCPDCGSHLIESITKKANQIICSNKLCKYKILREA
jgi:DNA topoisomerase-1